MENILFLLIEEVLCWLFLLWGLSLLIQTKLWIKLLRFIHSQSEETMNLGSLMVGALLLPVTVGAVLIHNDWSLNPFIIVTIFVWLALIKTVFLVLWPQLLLKCKHLYSQSESFLNWYLRGGGVVYIILSLIICMSE